MNPKLDKGWKPLAERFRDGLPAMYGVHDQEVFRSEGLLYFLGRLVQVLRDCIRANVAGKIMATLGENTAHDTFGHGDQAVAITPPKNAVAPVLNRHTDGTGRDNKNNNLLAVFLKQLKVERQADAIYQDPACSFRLFNGCSADNLARAFVCNAAYDMLAAAAGDDAGEFDQFLEIEALFLEFEGFTFLSVKENVKSEIVH